LVTGRVQGVGFRAFACAEARRLDLRGWVRNRPDGSVESIVCGANDGVSAFTDACRAGPPLARVEDLQVQPADDADVENVPAGAYRF
jgi:acylphosphatase